MFLIVGLGNPGKEYDNTRHNIGFETVDYIANKYNIDINRKKFKGVCGEGFINNTKVILLKPSTYMNLSGESVAEAMNFYKLKNEDLIIIYDDISLEVGRLRIREKGSAGGHNGIKSIISNLSSEAFPRIKIGVGQPKGDLVYHVLGKFNKEEMEILKEVVEAASVGVETIIKDGTKEAMNKLNGFKASNIE
ncbi:aminoacyl-tRNA hydrolase [Clostridium isatidis]|uniref:Peptidyl-tRNA hydrolase n=1 Tax=Clostridium isatidis TaxID=182773 RepID=A0A343J975_9CLOT|nr:aminoacyl-tRNA hydrolase [Clostridium isatidis]ASW42083.1 aminoacyl-tRNA hydrolase [Clostridium isatidis]NLZ34298.1 aminoacyl-tRNA hydrolase [Clostridiales bacterium]